jgi:GNAT superfamily N-acetyltransferase
MNDFLIVEENLRTAMRFFGYATGTGEIASLPGSVVMNSGLDYGVFNIAMLEGRVSRSGLSLEQRLAEMGHYFKSRTTRWSLWVCEDLLDQDVRRRARQVIGDFGLRAISHPPGMLAAELLPPVTALPRVEIEPVSEAALQRAFTEITSISFEIPFEIARAVYACDSAWQGEYRGYVGLAEGRPVSIVALVRSGHTLGVYSLATHPNWRRQGYGEATMRAAIERATRETEAQQIVLQSTEAGYPLYKRMGFRDVTRFAVYLTK